MLTFMEKSAPLMAFEGRMNREQIDEWINKQTEGNSASRKHTYIILTPLNPTFI